MKWRSLSLRRPSQSHRSFEMSCAAGSGSQQAPASRWTRARTHHLLGGPERGLRALVVRPDLRAQVPSQLRPRWQDREGRRSTHLLVLDREEDEAVLRLAQDGLVAVAPDRRVADEARVALGVGAGVLGVVLCRGVLALERRRERWRELLGGGRRRVERGVVLLRGRCRLERCGRALVLALLALGTAAAPPNGWPVRARAAAAVAAARAPPAQPHLRTLGRRGEREVRQAGRGRGEWRVVVAVGVGVVRRRVPRGRDEHGLAR